MNNSTNWDNHFTMRNSIVPSNQTSSDTQIHPIHPLHPTVKIFVMSLLFLTVFFHSCGLYLLFTVKRKRLSTTPNNIVPYVNVTLLIMLSFTEMISALSFLVSMVSNLIVTGVNVRTKHYIIVKSIAFYLTWISIGINRATMYSITLNRLISTKYPFWYQSSMSKKKFYTVLICTIYVTLLFFSGCAAGISESEYLSEYLSEYESEYQIRIFPTPTNPNSNPNIRIPNTDHCINTINQKFGQKNISIFFRVSYFSHLWIFMFFVSDSYYAYVIH